VIAPFSIGTEELSRFPLFGVPVESTQPTGIDISLSTAAVLSARFPWLTPPGSILVAVPNTNQSTALGKTVQLVDGGYLDNSGVTTALVIIREIEAAIAKMTPSLKVQINLVILTSGDFANPNVVLGDYLAPFQALLSTRGARAEIAIKEAERVFATGTPGPNPLRALGKVELHGYGYPLPLGWHLSPITRLLILGQNDDRALCSVDKKNCLSAKIIEEMNR
jgi:hypothetical protein